MSNRKLLKVINAKNKLNLLNQLRIEEILMRNSSGNYFILNSGLIDTSVVLGISGKPLELIDMKKCKDANIKVIRRFSGGGTVIVDKSTIFSTFVLNVKICYLL
jgi:lipoate-protein ligase A